jgi:hypothetical protein
MGCGGSKANEGANNKSPSVATTAKGVTPQAPSTPQQPAADVPPEQVVRIVLKETLLSLKPKAAKAVTSAPGKDIDASDWQKCAVKVEEGAESLILHYTMAHYKGAIALAQWGKNAQTVFLEVGDLPPIVHREAPKQSSEEAKEAEPSTEPPAEVDPDEGLKSTHSFIVSWKEKEGGATNRLIFGCKDEMQCDSWKMSIRQYCNIKTRCLFSYLWKVNSDISNDYTGGDLPKGISDLSNWRYRLFSLHEQKKDNSYCMTYVSEKNGAEFSIACVLKREGDPNAKGIKAKVTVLPVITLDPIGEQEATRFRTSVEQYRVATGYHTMPEALPTQFHAFVVEWYDDTEGEEGEKRVICAAAHKPTTSKWLENIENVQK